MTVQIFHHRKKCIGCYACVVIAPDRWRMSKKDGKSVLLGGKEKKGMWSTTVDEEEFEKNRNAGKVCPARIILVKSY